MTAILSELFAAEADAIAVMAYTYASGNNAPYFVTWGERDAVELIPDNERMTTLARRSTVPLKACARSAAWRVA